MLAAVLALASAVAWGFSDFLGGFLSRRHALVAVMVVSQAMALVLIAAGTLAGLPAEHDGAATGWAALAGCVGLIGLASFYRALTIGTMSIVAPISATGTAIPVLVGLLGGERPSVVQLAGIALAVAGVVLASRQVAEDEAAARRNRAAVALALVAAVGFGSFFAGIDKAEESGDVAWVLLAARTPSVALLLVAFALSRPPVPRDARSLGAFAAVGSFDLLANGLFVLAAGEGLLSVVGVLGSLYPAVTVLLAHLVLHEQLDRMQRVGVAVTLAGVVGLAAG